MFPSPKNRKVAERAAQHLSTALTAACFGCYSACISKYIRMVELIVEMIFAVLVIALDVVIVMHLLRGAPYLPTHRESVAKMIELAQVRPADKMVDLGSGDGRIVIAFAKQGIEAHGYEVNPLLVWWSRKNIQRAGLDGRAFIQL